jgi:pSer/pThr/pTyr-binding forkhead associated (FHA) protein
MKKAKLIEGIVDEGKFERPLSLDWEYPLNPGRIFHSIGRNSECDVHTPDGVKSVSRVHAGLKREGERLYLIDLASKAGTFKMEDKGDFVRVMGYTELREGDIFRLGDQYCMKYVEVEE